MHARTHKPPLTRPARSPEHRITPEVGIVLWYTESDQAGEGGDAKKVALDELGVVILQDELSGAKSGLYDYTVLWADRADLYKKETRTVRAAASDWIWEEVRTTALPLLTSPILTLTLTLTLTWAGKEAGLH